MLARQRGGEEREVRPVPSLISSNVGFLRIFASMILSVTGRPID
jgi:hypothetical protein